MRRGSVDPDSAQGLSEALKALHVAMGHARLYGASHKETWKAMEQSLEGIRPLLEAFGSIDLDSAQEGLSWNGQRVHTEVEDLVGLGRLLHREGIATLSLAQGLELEELGRLLDVLRINFELPEYEEETLESLLWQAGFQRIGFQAVSALMEAEALSGRVGAGPAELDMEGAVRRIVDLRVSDVRNEMERRNLGQVSEDIVRRAVARSDLAGLGPADEQREVLEEARAWRVRFAEEGTEDAQAIEQMRQEVESESAADLLARLVSVLMRTVVAHRPELPPQDAVGLARQAVEEVYRRGDAVGLVRILDEGTAMLEEPGIRQSPLAGAVREFFANAISTIRISRVLLSLDLSMAGSDSDLTRLVERLPDSVLQSVLETATRDRDPERGRRLTQTLGVVVGDRIDGWLQNAASQPPERVVPTISLARSLGRSRAIASRPPLLSHPSRLVREEVLRWYVEDLPPDDLPRILPLVLDPHAQVRRGATDVLVAHRPYEAIKFLRKHVELPSFCSRPLDVKRDLCIAFGLVAVDGAVESLEKRLVTPTKMMGTPASVVEDIEAGARGLAAVGSVAAKLALKRGTSGLFGVRKRLSLEALKRLEEGRPW